MTSRAQSPPPPFVVAVLGQKGGVGKTTLALNLAAASHLDGRRTLAIDCDRQGSLWDWYKARRDASSLAGLSVVRADASLSLTKFREVSSGYDVTVVDGPPRLGDITTAAAVAADVVLLPARAGAFDAWAARETVDLLDHADKLREVLGRPRLRRVIVVNGVPARSGLLAFALDAFRGASEVAPMVIGNRVIYASTAASGESVLTAGPTTRAADEIRALWAAVSGPAPEEAVLHVH